VPADLLIYALVAAGLVFWLKSILGTRHGEERERPNPFTAPPPDTRPAADQHKPVSPEEAGETAPGLFMNNGPALALPRHVTLVEQAQSGLLDIINRDASFDPGGFVLSAQDAFVMIVEAFAKADRDLLRDLLTDQVYASFDEVLIAREKSGETVSTEIHAIRRADILEARLDRHTAFITLQFTADETCVIKNSEGKIISGHPDRVTEMVDVWTFTRDLKSKDPRWLVCETRDGETREDHKTPVPDAG
jgi:predicted lipid-binding transport protein (Tim44 family)